MIIRNIYMFANDVFYTKPYAKTTSTRGIFLDVYVCGGGAWPSRTRGTLSGDDLCMPALHDIILECARALLPNTASL